MVKNVLTWVLCQNVGGTPIYNIIFKNKRPVGIIDFDVAGPGPRLWDIAYTLYTCIPLSRFSVLNANQVKKRVRLFFESYGEKVNDYWLKMVLLRLEGLCKLMTRKASEGDVAFQKMVDEGHLEHYQKELQFIREHGEEWI
jgi:thiamine kinase-like enzyme